MKNLGRFCVLFLLLCGVTTRSTDLLQPADLANGFWIEIQNWTNGKIQIVPPDSSARQTIGRVIEPATQFSLADYTAARWAHPGEVAATAVNAIHLKIFSQANGHSKLLSLLPRFERETVTASFVRSDSALQTNIPAGVGIFGGDSSPYVGDTFSLWRQGHRLDLSRERKLNTNEIIRIHIGAHLSTPRVIRFPNKRGGIVTARYDNGLERPVAQVIQPVHGTGRFGGTQLIEPSRVRANHRGVICISTSKRDLTGGFQIIPLRHSRSPEMRGARRGAPQWMIVGPVKGPAQLVGSAPLFLGSLRPGDRVYMRRRGHAEWEPLPTLNGLSQNNLEEMEEFEIVRGKRPYIDHKLTSTLTSSPASWLARSRDTLTDTTASRPHRRKIGNLFSKRPDNAG